MLPGGLPKAGGRLLLGGRVMGPNLMIAAYLEGMAQGLAAACAVLLLGFWVGIAIGVARRWLLGR